MTRLLFLTETHPPDRGGMSESCDRILRGLARSGVRIDLVHFDRRAARLDHRVTSGGSHVCVPLEADAAHTVNLLWNRLESVLDLRATTHVVAFGGTLPFLAAPVFAAWMARPLVTMIRGNELDAGLFDPRRRPMLDEALRRAVVVCTVTTSQAEKIRALHPDAQTHVVANGIDFEQWLATSADEARAREWRAQNVEAPKRVLGCFGHLKNKKGVPFFVDALRHSGFADRFHLLLAGELEASAAGLMEGVAHTQLPTMDRFELLPLYLACDLVVLPSHYDGFPNVLIEAMALGRPILGSTAGGMRDVLADGEEAFLFAPGDIHACREAIARAATASEQDLQRMGAAAEAVARRRCNARDETRRYLEVLDRAQEALDANSDSGRRSVSTARELSWRPG